jgi:hypothetical protein
MSDKTTIKKIESIAHSQYMKAFLTLRKEMSESDLLMLKTHYESPNYDLSATQLAKRVRFANYEAANLRYGLLANKLLGYFNLKFDTYIKLNILVYLYNINGEWHWVLRPRVAKALNELKWFPNNREGDLLLEISKFTKESSNLSQTTREAIIQSRIGQGKFRADLLDYWKGCSVSGCRQFEILKASHIKPWSKSTNKERLNPFNGLILIPNLDVCFDSGLISFKNNGDILISDELLQDEMTNLSIRPDMKLQKVEREHQKYLEYHRTNVFRF